jgi:hypothetical protein
VREPVNMKAAVAVGAACLIGLGLIFWLSGSTGPATRCELRGGHYLVGPGGEAACIDRNTFVPMPE